MPAFIIKKIIAVIRSTGGGWPALLVAGARVAVTGAGANGVFRLKAMEAALVRSWSAAARGGRHDPTAGTGAEKPGPGGARADGEVERGSFAAGHPQPPPARQPTPSRPSGTAGPRPPRRGRHDAHEQAGVRMPPPGARPRPHARPPLRLPGRSGGWLAVAVWGRGLLRSSHLPSDLAAHHRRRRRPGRQSRDLPAHIATRHDPPRADTRRPLPASNLAEQGRPIERGGYSQSTHPMVVCSRWS